MVSSQKVWSLHVDKVGRYCIVWGTVKIKISANTPRYTSAAERGLLSNRVSDTVYIVRPPGLVGGSSAKPSMYLCTVHWVWSPTCYYSTVCAKVLVLNCSQDQEWMTLINLCHYTYMNMTNHPHNAHYGLIWSYFQLRIEVHFFCLHREMKGHWSRVNLVEARSTSQRFTRNLCPFISTCKQKVYFNHFIYAKAANNP